MKPFDKWSKEWCQVLLAKPVKMADLPSRKIVNLKG